MDRHCSRLAVAMGGVVGVAKINENSLRTLKGSQADVD
jgi:hypothetical protein